MNKASNTKHEAGRRHKSLPVLGAIALVLAAIVVAGCAGATGGEQTATRSSASPAPRPETAQPSPTSPPPGLPPEREGFTPAPEQYAVMGDPHAPVTVVEYSDYQ